MKFFILIFILFISLESFANSLKPIVKISGASTIFPIVEDLAKAYNDKYNNEIIFKIKAGGSGRGIKDLNSGSVDIAMSSRAVSREEINSDILINLIGYDGLTVIVNSDLEVEEISITDIKRIFEGNIKTWKSITGDNVDIIAVVKEKGRSTRKLFDKFFHIQDVRKDAVIIGSNFEEIAYVAGTPAAIGCISIGTSIEAQKIGVDLKTLNLGGITPTTKNIKNKTYPLKRELNLLYKKSSPKHLEDFIRFINSKDGQNIIAAKQFVKAYE